MRAECVKPLRIIQCIFRILQSLVSFHIFQIYYESIYRLLRGKKLLHICSTLPWRHNVHDGVSNLQLHDCSLSRLFGRRSKKTSKLRVTGLCARNSSVTGEFPAQTTSNAENVSIWWRHYEISLDWFHDLFGHSHDPSRVIYDITDCDRHKWHVDCEKYRRLLQYMTPFWNPSLIQAWMSNHMASDVRDEIIHPFPT